MGNFEMAMEAVNRMGKMGENLPKEDLLKGMGILVEGCIYVGLAYVLGNVLGKGADRMGGYIRDIICAGTNK